MRIAVTGSTGLIGSALVRSLRDDDHEVVRLVRRPSEAGDEVEWDPERGYIDSTGLVGCEAVVHLAGAPVPARPWTAKDRHRVRESRVAGTAALAEVLTSLDPLPRTFLSASGVDYYADCGDRKIDESGPRGSHFMSEICQAWEAATAPAEKAGVRTVRLRTGIVLSRAGGAGARLFPLFKAGLGGRMGNGRQYWSFISLHDHIAALRHLLETGSLSGPVNMAAPEPVTNREVTAALGRVLHRPTLAMAPAPVLRLALGEFAESVLGSRRMVPAKLLESGFTFAFPDIDDAIRAGLR